MHRTINIDIMIYISNLKCDHSSVPLWLMGVFPPNHFGDSFWDVSSTFQDCLHLPALVMPLLSLGAVAYSCYSKGIPLFMDGNCVICLSKLNPAPAKILSCGHVPWYFKDISGETHAFQDGDWGCWISLSAFPFSSSQHSEPYIETGGWKVLECSNIVYQIF